MARLSWHQVQYLAFTARWNHGREHAVHCFKRHIDLRCIVALKRRNLIEFNPLFGKFNPTGHGERALMDHGYSTAGQWQGSNEPRKYR